MNTAAHRTKGDRRRPAKSAAATTSTGLNPAPQAEKSDAVSNLTVGELFRLSAAQNLDPYKVLGGVSSFPAVTR